MNLNHAVAQDPLVPLNLPAVLKGKLYCIDYCCSPFVGQISSANCNPLLYRFIHWNRTERSTWHMADKNLRMPPNCFFPSTFKPKHSTVDISQDRNKHMTTHTNTKPQNYTSNLWNPRIDNLIESKALISCTAYIESPSYLSPLRSIGWQFSSLSRELSVDSRVPQLER